MNPALKFRFRTAIYFLSFTIFFAGCTMATPIKKILDDPRDYSEKTVTISGTVTEVMGLFVLRYFVVKDATGEITVITSRPLPRKGQQIKVTGTVREAFSIGDKQLIVIVENEPKPPS